jgi:hypothetical protein
MSRLSLHKFRWCPNWVSISSYWILAMSSDILVRSVNLIISCSNSENDLQFFENKIILWKLKILFSVKLKIFFIAPRSPSQLLDCSEKIKIKNGKMADQNSLSPPFPKKKGKEIFVTYHMQYGICAENGQQKDQHRNSQVTIRKLLGCRP